jgi:hypothetical protein
VVKGILIHTNVKLLKVDLHREHFTQHGQHLNHSGKELVSLELAKIIDQLFNEVCLHPIYIQWKDYTLEDKTLTYMINL